MGLEISSNDVLVDAKEAARISQQKGLHIEEGWTSVRPYSASPEKRSLADTYTYNQGYTFRKIPTHAVDYPVNGIASRAVLGQIDACDTGRHLCNCRTAALSSFQAYDRREVQQLSR
jgi:hypothetical protein